MGVDGFSAADLESLRRRGLTVDDVRAQLHALRNPPPFLTIDRPCTLGDGIRVVRPDEVADLTRLHDEAAHEGRCMKFVPASGAATRMFRDLLHYEARGGPVSRDAIRREAEGGSGEARSLLAFMEGISRFAFADDLDRSGDLDRLVRSGSWEDVLDRLFSREGLGYGGLPKGLVAFHAYPRERRTPFEEHLVEAAALVRDAHGVCRLHLTVSPEHVARFHSLLDRVRGSYESALGASFDVGFSTQKPSTDTVALDSRGEALRLDDGTLAFRPSGHGALLENLADLRADVVLIKNIDNVVPDRAKEPTYTWSRVLGGCLVRSRREALDWARRLERDGTDGAIVEGAVSFLRDTFHVGSEVGLLSAGERRAALLRLLERPVRVCGMVKNRGEPGGGPFWVRGADGTVSLQIVESAQVDPDSEEQQGHLARSTHFNPVFMACGLRDAAGRPHDLGRYVDPDAAIVTRKSHEGREIRALERPGLWNGSMAWWNTIFVEVPIEVFNPVKTVNDLLRDEHRT